MSTSVPSRAASARAARNTPGASAQSSSPTTTGPPASKSPVPWWTTMTGHGAWPTTCSATDPRIALRTAPRPRLPTTSRSACAALSTNTRAAAPGALRTVTGTSSTPGVVRRTSAPKASALDSRSVRTLSTSGASIAGFHRHGVPADSHHDVESRAPAGGREERVAERRAGTVRAVHADDDQRPRDLAVHRSSSPRPTGTDRRRLPTHSSVRIARDLVEGRRAATDDLRRRDRRRPAPGNFTAADGFHPTAPRASSPRSRPAASSSPTSASSRPTSWPARARTPSGTSRSRSSARS